MKCASVSINEKIEDNHLQIKLALKKTARIFDALKMHLIKKKRERIICSII
jgi:hypothetical protein